MTIGLPARIRSLVSTCRGAQAPPCVRSKNLDLPNGPRRLSGTDTTPSQTLPPSAEQVETIQGAVAVRRGSLAESRGRDNRPVDLKSHEVASVRIGTMPPSGRPGDP